MKRRSGVPLAAEERRQLGFGGAPTDRHLDRPGRGRRLKRLRERRHQVVDQDFGEWIIVVANAEQGRPRLAARPPFVLDDGARVGGVGLRRRQTETADRVADVELKLNVEGHLERAADEQQVGRHPSRIDRSRADAVAQQEVALGLARQVGHAAVEVPRRLPPELEQGLQRLLDGGVGVAVKDDSPTGRGQIPPVEHLGPSRRVALHVRDNTLVT